jgi:hypothetical protein
MIALAGLRLARELPTMLSWKARLADVALMAMVLLAVVSSVANAQSNVRQFYGWGGYGSQPTVNVYPPPPTVIVVPQQPASPSQSLSCDTSGNCRVINGWEVPPVPGSDGESLVCSGMDPSGYHVLCRTAKSGKTKYCSPWKDSIRCDM